VVHSTVAQTMTTGPRLEPLGARQKLRLAAEVLATYPAMMRLVRGSDLPRMVAAARAVRASAPPVAPALEHEYALRLGVAVTRTLRLVPTDARCLVRSVVLTRMLSRRSIPSDLIVGVTSGQSFAAHAWVEHAHQPVLPPGQHERLLEL
jgi:hypothetical protein